MSGRKKNNNRKSGKNPILEAFGWYKHGDYYDYNLVAVIILLTCFGLVMLYSTSSYMARINYNGDDMHYFRKQGLISLVCFGVAIIVSKFDYHLLWKWITPIYGMGLFLMVLVKTPLGVTANGARRWLGVGSFTFQPAEVAKIAVIVTLSYMIVKMGRNVRKLKACMYLALAGGIQTLGAYVLTDNLSTAIIILCITIGMIFVAHPELKVFLVILAVGVAGVILFVAFLYSVLDPATVTDFRLRRILVWLRPEEFADSDGYQTLQALYAIGSGGFLGRGLGNSIQKLGSIPEAQNDMIFSIICEELGVLGAIIVLLLFAYLLYRLFFIAQNAADLFGSMIVTGIFIHIALQVILNISVVLNIIPNTGVTLPFISYGGTSILFLMAEMGLALSVSRQIKFQELE